MHVHGWPSYHSMNIFWPAVIHAWMFDSTCIHFAHFAYKFLSLKMYLTSDIIIWCDTDPQEHAEQADGITPFCICAVLNFLGP